MRLTLRLLSARFRQGILTSRRQRAALARLGAFLNAKGYRAIAYSRACVRVMNHHVTSPESDWYVHGLARLHQQIEEVLRRQRREYGSYYYFYGFPYQALGILGVYGERATEERFESYALRDLIYQRDRVLDIGCNCGFMALYTAYRTGCRADGVDINPHMVEIGTLCTEYLRLSDRVTLQAARIQDFAPTQPYTVVFSFATHWTDDENYRVPLREHFERCATYLAPRGLLVFESHANDVGNADFYAAIDGIVDLFDLDSKRDTDRGARHLYLFRRK